MDKEFLQYIKDMRYDDLLDIDEKDIGKFKDTYNYQFWRLGNSYKELTNAMRETKLFSVMISIVEFLDKCFNKIF